MQEEHRAFQSSGANAEREVRVLQSSAVLQDQRIQQLESQFGLLRQALESNLKTESALQPHKTSNVNGDERVGFSPRKYATLKLTVKGHSINGNRN